MTETKGKAKPRFLVLPTEALESALYDGPDKAKARAAAGDAINGGKTVVVIRGRARSLDKRHLEASVPKDAF